MKLTRDTLKKIIKEELEEMMGEPVASPAYELFQLMKTSGRSLSGFVEMALNIQAGGTPTRDTAAIEKIKDILSKLPNQVKEPDGKVNGNRLVQLIQKEVEMEREHNPNSAKTVYENKKKSK